MQQTRQWVDFLKLELVLLLGLLCLCGPPIALNGP